MNLPAAGATSAGSLSTGQLVGYAAAAVVTLTACWVGRKVQSTRQYWLDCKRETTATPGVEASSWLQSSGSGSDGGGGGGAPVWFRVNDVIMGGRSTSGLKTDGCVW
jgi:hypothetical protein